MLSLEGTPARDVITLTAAVWSQAIGSGKAWSERRDAPRFEAAFETLCRTCRRWPAPADFLAAVPALPSERREMPRRIESDASKAHIQSIVDGLAKRFSVKAPVPPAAAAAEVPVEGHTVTHEQLSGNAVTR